MRAAGGGRGRGDQRYDDPQDAPKPDLTAWQSIK
jgi:hypothetical protein